MKEFKLLAIRPLPDCNSKYIKMLQPGVLYRFHTGFQASENPIDDLKFEKFKLSSALPQSFYDISYPEPKKELAVSLSAIVGRNGSGKSSIIDLLFVAIFNLSLEKRVLIDRKRKEPLLYEPGIKVEIYYQQGENIYVTRMDSGKNDRPERFYQITNTYLFQQEKAGDWVYKRIVPKQPKLIYEYFFYTIAVNYSIYGLNSDTLGDWIVSLFHKNDVYQTPIVINPWRTNGNIDIGVENELVNQRLLANILAPIAEKVDLERTLRNLAPGKTAKYLELTLDTEKIDEYKERIAKKKVSNEMNCLTKLYSQYTGVPVLATYNKPELDQLIDYILNKLRKICKNYGNYGRFLSKGEYQDVEGFVNKLIGDGSHITFKLKQALNQIRYHDEIQKTKNSDGMIDIGDYSEMIRSIIDTEKQKPMGRGLRVIELIPPTVYKIRILFDKKHGFDDFSSGEKQKIHSINSIIYHLINLNSVFESKENTIKIKQNQYRFVNIIFDEIELYFHPDLQRRFVYDLIDYVAKINPEHVWFFEGIHMLFITHSPFILSDIPDERVLYLEVDKTGHAVPAVTKGKSFGANIHDLLANDFFMRDGFMGEMAKRKIQSVIKFLKDGLNSEDLSKAEDDEEKILAFSCQEWDEASVKQFIDLVGEPMIKKSLLDLYFRRFGKDAVQKEIDRLNQLMEGMTS